MQFGTISPLMVLCSTINTNDLSISPQSVISCHYNNQMDLFNQYVTHLQNVSYSQTEYTRHHCPLVLANTQNQPVFLKQVASALPEVRDCSLYGGSTHSSKSNANVWTVPVRIEEWSGLDRCVRAANQTVTASKGVHPKDVAMQSQIITNRPVHIQTCYMYTLTGCACIWCTYNDLAPSTHSHPHPNKYTHNTRVN